MLLKIQWEFHSFIEQLRQSKLPSIYFFNLENFPFNWVKTIRIKTREIKEDCRLVTCTVYMFTGSNTNVYKNFIIYIPN